MERFVVLITTTDQQHAEGVCAHLEDADIPVMLEHVEIHDGTLRACGYRLMVPAQFSQTARRLAEVASPGILGPFATSLQSAHSRPLSGPTTNGITRLAS